jgi:hypothetical protein
MSRESCAFLSHQRWTLASSVMKNHQMGTLSYRIFVSNAWKLCVLRHIISRYLEQHRLLSIPAEAFPNAHSNRVRQIVP